MPSIKIYSIIFFFITTSLRGQNPYEIIQHYIDTASDGDINNWAKIKTVYMESVGFYSQQKFDQSLPDFSEIRPNYEKTYREWPDKSKTELYEDSTYNKFLSATLWLTKKNKLILTFNTMEPIIKPFNGELWDFYPVVISKMVKESKAVKYKGIKNFITDGISCF